MDIDACIFDLDGVIVDTAKFHYTAWQQLASSLGIEFSKEENENLKGVGRMESLDYILHLGKVEKSGSEKLKLATLKNEHYLSLISEMNESEILDGVLSFLQELKDSTIKIALGSSSKNARPILNKLNIDTYFDVIIDGTNTTKSKPDPQVFLLAAKKLETNPSNIIVFEDASKGIEAAKNGGFKAIGVGDQNQLNSADYVIPDFSAFGLSELLDLKL